MIFGFDIISDLHIDESTPLDWESKPTSLYCLIPGNLTEDMQVLHKTLKHLSKQYQGVFYIEGSLEHKTLADKEDTTDEISKICDSIKNVVYLYNNVVVVEGIALVGINGWHNNCFAVHDEDQFQIKSYKYDDLLYLEKTIERLQLHIDVKKIVIMSSSVPSPDLYFGEMPIQYDNMDMRTVLDADTEGKVTTWVFGTDKKIVDTKLAGINYLSNPCHDRDPYYATRMNIEV
jgi:predicted phosphohydrolase